MIPGLSLTKVLIGSAVLVGGGVGVIMLLSSKLPPATPLEELPDLIHDRVASTIAAELPAPRGDGRLILPPMPGDRNEALRTRLARAIDRSGRYEVIWAEEAPPENWFEQEVLPRIADWLAVLPGLSRDDDRPGWLLDLRVDERQDDADALALSVLWRLRDLAEDGRSVTTGDAREQIDRSLGDVDYLRWRIGEMSVWWRGLLWLAAVLGPWIALRTLFVEVLGKESNGWNAALWVFVAVPGVVSGYILTAFAAGWGGAVLAFLSGVATLVFAYAWLNWLESTRR